MNTILVAVWFLPGTGNVNGNRKHRYLLELIE